MVNPAGTALFTWERRMGRPTSDNIRSEVKAYERSFRPGGANCHIGSTPIISEAWVVNQKTRQIAGRWKAPMFEVEG